MPFKCMACEMYSMSEEESTQSDEEQLGEGYSNFRDNSERKDVAEAHAEKGERSALSERVAEGDLSIEDIDGGHIPRRARSQIEDIQEADAEAKSNDE